jgi:alpha-mannosidase
MAQDASKPTLYVFVNNHFDPTWRRCWDRRFVFKGETYVSYADLEAYYMLDNLALARQHPDYKFEAESVIVVRKFLERHPEHRETLVQLAQEGRFGITGAGEAIIDANMVLGESLVRNYLQGLLWVEEVFDQTTALGVRNDAFGNSAQLPQILRGCEIAWCTGLFYTPAEGVYWRGLDGSVIVHATLPVAARGGGNTKYAPCPMCRGTGKRAEDETPCERCDGRGIDGTERAWLPREVHAEALAAWPSASNPKIGGVGLVSMTPEELLPNPALIGWVARMRETYDVHFALEADVRPYIQPWLDRADDPPEDEVHPGVELNPNNAGCWVTRIKTKQTCRRQEYALLATESLYALAALATFEDAAATDSVVYPTEALHKVWQKLFFTMFHDAITATHVDPAYRELQDVWGLIDAETTALRARVLDALVRPGPDLIAVFNPSGHAATQTTSVVLPSETLDLAVLDAEGHPVPVVETREVASDEVEVTFVAHNVPPFSVRRYRVEAGQAPPKLVTGTEPVIENQRFRICADEQGLQTVFDKHLGVDILQAAAYRPGELILEHDEGSPWATLHPDQTRHPLAEFTRLVAVEKGRTDAGAAAFERLIFEAKTPRGMGFTGHALQARVVVTLTAGIERVDFTMRADWDAFNHRLRVAMPTPFGGQHHYEIPYGILARQPYDPTFGWAGANGDWPAINWAGVEGDGASVALFNRGLPSYRIEADPVQGSVILLSVLRSPAVPTYLHEPEFYTMTDWDGMRDAGKHRFDYAVTAYPGPLPESDVVLDAASYNAGLLAVAGGLNLPEAPQVRSKVARLAALKWAEQGQALILRLHEFRGKGGPVEVRVPSVIKRVARVNLLERQAEPLALEDGRVSLTVRSWEIATLCLTLS